MGFLTSLFGGETSYVTAAIALGIVLVLIVLAVWLIKLVGDASRNVGRGRNRRLLVVDSVAIDNRRQAVIVRRDDTEHLIVIGGPNDLVVETGFEPPAIQPVNRMPKRKPAPQPAQPAPEPAAPAPAPRIARPAAKPLRHPGLLRAVEPAEPPLGGGKLDKPARFPGDSATSETRSASGTVEPEREEKERDYADETSRNR